MRAAILACATTSAVLTGAAEAPPAQEGRQPPAFRVEVNYVEIDAMVTDAQGNFVRGLTKDDFELSEEGQPQKIASLTVVDLPVTKADPPLFRKTVVEPDVRSNIGDFNGRVILLVLDDLQTDFRRTLLVRHAAAQFVRRFVGANDLAAVVTTGGRTGAMQDFTTSQSRLLTAIERFSGQKPRRGSDRATELELVTKSENSLRALGSTAEFLGNIRGRRKAVVWFAEGLEYDIDNPMNTHSMQLRDEMRAAINAATRAGVSFYAVDPRGVGAGLDEAIDLTGVDADFSKESGMQAVMNETRRAQSFLRTMSSETGGFAVVNQNDLNGAFSKIIQENSSYYLLGYYPSNDRRDGKFRKVTVRVRRPGVEIRHRVGYAAPRGRASTRDTAATAAAATPDLRAALESPLPVNGLGMRVFAAAFAGPAKKGSVVIVVELDPSRMRFDQDKGAYAETLELIILPVNASGKALDGAHDRAPLRLSEKSYQLARANGLRMTRRLDLPYGRYQLHLAAKASNGNAVGGVAYDLDVPDYSQQPLAMSALTVMSATAMRMLAPPPDKEIADVLPVPATALRDFPAGDTLSAYVEIYNNRAATPHAVEIRTSVTADDGRVVFNASDQRRTEEINAKSGGFGHVVKIPLVDLRPGRYVLRVDAQALVSKGASVARELEFRVR